MNALTSAITTVVGQNVPEHRLSGQDISSAGVLPISRTTADLNGNVGAGGIDDTGSPGNSGLHRSKAVSRRAQVAASNGQTGKSADVYAPSRHSAVAHGARAECAEALASCNSEQSIPDDGAPGRYAGLGTAKGRKSRATTRGYMEQSAPEQETVRLRGKRSEDAAVAAPASPEALLGFGLSGEHRYAHPLAPACNGLLLLFSCDCNSIY